jgi:hypothetical protein
VWLATAAIALPVAIGVVATSVQEVTSPSTDVPATDDRYLPSEENVGDPESWNDRIMDDAVAELESLIYVNKWRNLIFEGERSLTHDAVRADYMIAVRKSNPGTAGAAWVDVTQEYDVTLMDLYEAMYREHVFFYNPDEEPVEPVEPEPQFTVSQENAIAMAKDYLKFSAFSETGLIGQLKFEGFSKADARFAVNHIWVDWNQQAVLMAKDYLEYSAFSREGLIEQLVFEGFTQQQATYGVNKTGL